MSRVVALLRGVNIAKRQLPMAALRSGLEAAGCTGVTTYVQSGNAMLVPPPTAGADVAGWLTAVVGEVAGFDVPVVVRTPPQLRELVAADPFTGTMGRQRHVVFCSAPPPATLTTELGDERALVVGGDVALRLPDGMGTAKLPSLVDRELRRAGIVGTARNWNTVEALLRLVEQEV